MNETTEETTPRIVEDPACGEAESSTITRRVFKYNGQTYDDPGPEYTVEEVKKHLATIFPEVSQAETEEKDLDDGTKEITFIKRAGTKG